MMTKLRVKLRSGVRGFEERGPGFEERGCEIKKDPIIKDFQLQTTNSPPIMNYQPFTMNQ